MSAFNRRMSKTMKDLKELHQHFVICKMDKLSHNLTIVCRKYYTARIMNELSSDAYASTNEAKEYIIARHREFNQRYNYKNPTNVLPHLYAVMKLHKNPIGMRFLAGVRTTLKTMMLTPRIIMQKE